MSRLGRLVQPPSGAMRSMKNRQRISGMAGIGPESQRPMPLSNSTRTFCPHTGQATTRSSRKVSMRFRLSLIHI